MNSVVLEKTSNQADQERYSYISTNDTVQQSNDLINEALVQRIVHLEDEKLVWEKQTVWQCFEKSAQRWPNVPCMEIETGISYSYKQVQEAAVHAATMLSQLGVKANTRVAVRCESSVDLIILSLALYCLGAVKIALSESMGIYEEAYKLANVDAELLIEDVTLHASEEVFDFDGATLVFDWSHAHATGSIEQWIFDLEHPVLIKNAGYCACKGVAHKDFHVCADEVADIFFTSGSTGAPKAVGLSHDMMLRSAWANCLNRAFSSGYRLCIPLPLSHVYGYIDGFLAVIQVGGTMLLPSKKLSPGDLVGFVKNSSAQDILLVPNLAMAMIESMREYPATFPYLEALYCSASSCPNWLWSALRTTFHVDRITTGYGMTEVCGASFQTAPRDSDAVLTQYVGKLMYAGAAGSHDLQDGTIVYKVIDSETGLEVSPGEAGELCCRGLTVFRGYLNNDEANEKSFDSEGWFHTGDIGRINSQGYLQLEGRTSETYKINGENVSPRFVERILDTSDLIKRIRIVGVPEARYGEVGAAFIELVDDNPENRESVREFCVSALARFQVPKYYFFVDEDFWPCNDTGKIVRPILRDRAIKHLSKRK